MMIMVSKVKKTMMMMMMMMIMMSIVKKNICITSRVMILTTI